MASFTALGNNTTVNLANRGDTALVALSGTYAATVELQQEVGAPGSGMWQKITSWNAANATVSYAYMADRDLLNLRLMCTAFTSGTVVATIVDNVDKELVAWKDPQGNTLLRITEEGVEISGALRRNAASGFKLSAQTYQITAALALTREKHAGKIGLFNVLAGVIATLPLATGTQDEYEFFVQLAPTSVSDDIVAAGSDIIQGAVLIALSSAVTATSAAAGSAAVKYQMNGTTKGGIKGSYVKLKDVATGIWCISGVLVGSGTIATGFA